MKNVVLIALLSLGSFAGAQTPTPAGASLDGKWKLHASIAGNDSDSECTFKQTGNDFSGTCKAAEQPEAKLTGKIDGNKITWSSAGDYNGTPLTTKYIGTLAADKISGELTVDPFGVTGEFSATREK